MNRHTHAINFAGSWLYVKVRRNARANGVQAAAKALRKQGAPLELALAILLGVKA